MARILELADKIYKTDEYQHKVSPEQVAKRAEKNKELELRTVISSSDPRYEVHALKKNLGGPVDYERAVGNNVYSVASYTPGSSTEYTKPLYYRQRAVPDTGKHRPPVPSTYNSVAYTGGVLRRDKEVAFDKFDAARRALNRLQQHQNVYDPEEYAEREAELVTRVDLYKKEYENAAQKLRE